MRAERFNIKLVEEGDTLTDNLVNGVLHTVYKREDKGLCIKENEISFQPLSEFLETHTVNFIIKPFA